MVFKILNVKLKTIFVKTRSKWRVNDCTYDKNKTYDRQIKIILWSGLEGIW